MKITDIMTFEFPVNGEKRSFCLNNKCWELFYEKTGVRTPDELLFLFENHFAKTIVAIAICSLEAAGEEADEKEICNWVRNDPKTVLSFFHLACRKMMAVDEVSAN